jgi:hypothetical protein
MLLVKPGQKHSSEKTLLLLTTAPLTPNRLLPAGLLLLFCPAKNCSGNCLPGTEAEKNQRKKNGAVMADSCSSAGANV